MHATASPSMDIQISSNFERLLFEASKRDASSVRRLMDSLKQSGRFVLPDAMLAAIPSRRVLSFQAPITAPQRQKSYWAGNFFSSDTIANFVFWRVRQKLWARAHAAKRWRAPQIPYQIFTRCSGGT